MAHSIWNIFPYPTLSGTDFESGTLLDPHQECLGCPSRECLPKSKGTIGELQVCRFGITYARVDDDRVVNGVLATDLPNMPTKARKRLKAESERRVAPSQIQGAIAKISAMGPGVVNDLRGSRKAVLEKLARDPQMHQVLVQQLREDFNKNLQQSHDFLQLVNLVKGHAEALLHEKHPTLSSEEAADQCEIEGSIYFSTRLMVLKIDSLKFLQEINKAFGGATRMQIHPLVIQYAKIYKWHAKQGNIHIGIDGECRAFSRYNSEAIGAVVQGLLDNLVKYAPTGSDAQIHFEQKETEIFVTFISLGPKIEQSELTKIFIPGYRADAARLMESSGQGIGLATAKSISDVLDLDLQVTQGPVENPKFPKHFETIFRIRLQTET